MAGISDLPYRLINRSFGSELAFTEMISATALVRKNLNTVQMLSTSEDDRPLGVQLLGRDPECIRRALDIVSRYDFDVIDLNAACPARKVVSGGKGAGMLKQPEELQKLMKIIVGYTTLPVTVKIRSGWDERSINAVEIALRAQDAGVSGIFIHGRTGQQKYSGKVNYNIIREVKKSVAIPVIASGDALTPVLVRKLFNETGCDGVVLARGLLGNPWIIRNTTEYIKNGVIPLKPGPGEIARAMRKHLALNIRLNDENHGVIRFRKFFGWYLRGIPSRDLRGRAFQATGGKEMFRLIDEVETLPVKGRGEERWKQTTQ